MRNEILALARAVRTAETARIAAGSKTLERYDGILHSRVDAACNYLAAVKCADDDYEMAMIEALGEYRDCLREEASQ